MDVIAALAVLDKTITLIGAIGSLAENAQKVSALIQKAQAEGRTALTADEWSTVISTDDAARKVLAEAISKMLTAQPLQVPK